MVSISITQGNKTTWQGELPEQYSELSDKQFIDIAYYIFSQKSIEECVIFVLWKLTGLKKKKFFSLHNEKSKNVADDSILDHLDKAMFVFKYTDLAIGESRLPITKELEGPADYLANITVEQFGYADLITKHFVASKDDEYIDWLFACLYLSPGEIFNEELVEHKSKKVNLQVDIKTRRAAFLNWLSLRKWLVNKYPYAFGGEDENGNSEFGWQETMIALAGEKFGTELQVRQVSIKTAMAYLNMLGYEREQAEINKQNNEG